jgi:chlorite dismutase
MSGQYVAYQFFRVDPAWRRLPVEERMAGKDAFAEVVEDWAGRMETLRAYTVTGVRPDSDFFLWKITQRYEDLGELGAALNATPLAGWLETPYSYLATTKASQYTAARRPRKIVPKGQPYLVVYPFVKTRPWYALPEEERQRAMDEHIRIGREEFPGITNHTTYSFGIDDQEFMTAFECDEPADEDRRVALGPARRLRLAEGHHQVHEVRRLLALERRHELLVVETERVRRVVRHGDELAADLGMLAHRRAPLFERQEVQRATLDEGVDDEVRRVARKHTSLAHPLLVRVDGGLRRRDVRVRRLEPRSERRCVERRSELDEVVPAVGDLPEEEVRIGAHPGRRVHTEPLDPARPVLDDLRERLLAGDALLDREPPPGGIETEEAVRDVLAHLHALDPLIGRL